MPARQSSAAPSAAAYGDDALAQLARRAGEALLAARRHVVTVESCTGGWVAKCLTDVAGSSQWFERGYVTYSNLAKEQSLGVAPAVIETFGAVSRPTAEQMAAGALHASGADLAVAVTGIAGPDGGSADKPVGLVWFALARPGAAGISEEHRFGGDREAVRRAAVATALKLLIAAAGSPPRP
ncbi:MAG TPA: nicotinamide-nucleotide amidohydrolase family protein [Steroidobacteraceae bacterium]|nr:nicotinamide-nucleotide amidohydrolase family protein [Steroidobacteraceae bacterium]